MQMYLIMNKKDKQIMRSFTQNFKMAGVTVVLSLFVQGCYTYVPSMSREADGVYYSPRKDAERTEYLKNQYNNSYQDYTSDAPVQQEYYSAPNTALEQAYWSTMPSTYSGGEVKIVNNYYGGTPTTSVVPNVNVSLGYGWGDFYSGWSFGIGFSLGTIFFGYNDPWYYGWGGGYYDPWYYNPWNYGWGGYYDPWYHPWYTPWGARHYGHYDPWINPYYNPWRDPWYGRPGHGGPSHRPIVVPPKRYSDSTEPNANRRPLTRDENDNKKPTDTRRPSSDGGVNSEYRPSTGGFISTSQEGYYRRLPANNPSGQYENRVDGNLNKGQGNNSGNNSNKGTNNNNPSVNYRPSTPTGTTTTPSKNEGRPSTNGERSEYKNIRGTQSGSSSPYYRPNGVRTNTTPSQTNQSRNVRSEGSSTTPTRTYNGTTNSNRTYTSPSSSSYSRDYDRGSSSSSPSYSRSSGSSSSSSSSPSYSRSSGSSSSSSAPASSSSGYRRR